MTASIDERGSGVIPTAANFGGSSMRMTWAVITALACIAFLAAPILAQSPEIEASTTQGITQIAKSLGIQLQLEGAVVTEVAATTASVAE